MAELEGSGGGAVGKIWRKHGGGYYALLAVGTFVYLEIRSLSDSFFEADGVRDFVEAELFEAIVTFGLETILNTFLAGIWPFMWWQWMGPGLAAAWAGGGYVVWAIVIAWALARREKAYRKELGL
ncbi:MAG: hypothetical protein AAF389_03475 [Gemmatimonadota bacterium]